MKKLILFLTVFLLYNCEIKVNPATANDVIIDKSYSALHYRKMLIDNIEYAIFYNTGSSYAGTSPFVINLTKDKLEIELLKKQLSNP